jgi:outer membrane protein OmpA-like peptidoglycan-associated protein
MRALLFSSMLLLASLAWAQAPDSQPTALPPASQPVQSYAKPEVITRRAIIVDRVLFSRGNATIALEDYAVLDEIALELNTRPDIILFEIQGHADPTTEGLYADKISLKRAKAAKEYLVSQGVDPERLEARGYAGRLPLTNGKSAKERAKNRPQLRR